MSRKAILLDRDGTLCEEVGYLTRIEELRLLDGCAAAIRRARDAGFLVILATNQSAVGRGLISEGQVAEAHRRLRELLAGERAALDDIYYCPHHPARGECACRKPRPGMLLEAARRHDLDLAECYMIGDRLRDVEAGHRAGATALLVLTGYGRREFEYHAGGREDRPAFVARDLPHAVDWILGRRQPSREAG